MIALDRDPTALTHTTLSNYYDNALPGVDELNRVDFIVVPATPIAVKRLNGLFSSERDIAKTGNSVLTHVRDDELVKQRDESVWRPSVAR